MMVVCDARSQLSSLISLRSLCDSSRAASRCLMSASNFLILSMFPLLSPDMLTSSGLTQPFVSYDLNYKTAGVFTTTIAFLSCIHHLSHYLLCQLFSFYTETCWDRRSPFVDYSTCTEHPSVFTATPFAAVEDE